MASTVPLLLRLHLSSVAPGALVCEGVLFLQPHLKMKPWGKKEFWGLGEEFDPDWLLTEEQKELRSALMEMCRTKIRPQAIECDRTYQFPKESIKALGDMGLLGLIIPKEMGGLGHNHTCAVMVVETLARYGCPSTAMIFTMHITSCSTLLFRYHNNPHLQQLLRRIPKEKLLGAVSASDPATGGHDWYPISSKVKYLKDEKTVQLLKFGSWVTSAGYADFYSIMTVSPTFEGSYGNMSLFVVYKDEVRANTDDWSALGMHANNSGPLMVEGEFSMERMIGPPGDAAKSMVECIDVYFLLLTSSCWNGIAMGCLDLARRHLTTSAHADIGMRICDYPTIQDAYGECVIDTTSSRSTTFLLSQMMDSVSNNGDWTMYSDTTLTPKTNKIHWCWQLKFTAAKNVANVTETMLRVCGGTAYKTELGLERLYRDGKAGWVMAPSNEVLRNLIGLAALTGFPAIDLWEESTNQRVVQREVKKMSPSQKEALGRQLLEEAARETSKAAPMNPYQGTDFVNPFNTAPPTFTPEMKSSDGVVHRAALHQDTWTSLTLISRYDLTSKMTAFTFALPNPTDHSGCLPGQFVAVRLMESGKQYLRYFSPVSRPDDFGRLEVVLKYETQGMLSTFFKSLQPGSMVEFKGPCGGFEYKANQLDEITVLVGGAGVTPALQLARCLAHDSADNTRLTLLYYSDSFQDILYYSELKQLEEMAKGQIQVIHTLGEVPEGWKGEDGFIDLDKINRFVTKPNGTKHKVVICGGPTMSIACLFSLQQLGFSPQSIYIYGQFGAELVKAVYGCSAVLSGHDCHTQG
ncbi:hypothetical protein O3P69_017546 [Scylla paramamosain]|uniref:FAD-binding FR-type domain-containing protein n=1 Tax=Scylla paramamosain TaxID=85552 RepID=A0AAW0TW96_SCYPA